MEANTAYFYQIRYKDNLMSNIKGNHLGWKLNIIYNANNLIFLTFILYPLLFFHSKSPTSGWKI